MPVRTIRFFSVFTAVVALGFLPHSVYSQIGGNRSALAAKQKLRDHVLDALADGKISRLERAEIVAEGKEILTVKELDGLRATMDRLSPRETGTATAKHSYSSNDRAIATAKQDRDASPKFLGRLVSSVPYIDDFSFGPHPNPSKIAKSIPYAKSPDIDFSAADRALAKVPRLSELYVAQPTADLPLPKITRGEGTSARIRTAARPSSSSRTPSRDKFSRSRYSDESITPLPSETKTARPNMLGRQYQAREATDPLAGTPRIEGDSSGRAIQTGAILSDRELPTNGGSCKLSQPQGLESEF
jgi:hypothetical protein